MAKNGEAIYFDFETNERIESPSVTINGVSLDSTTDVQMQSGDNSGMRWRATYTPSVDADVSVVSFSVDGFEDPAGNTRKHGFFFCLRCEFIQSVKDRCDATSAPFSHLGVFSTSDTLNDDDPDLTSTNTLLAKNGEAIYFDFETNERIESPSVTINGVTLATTDVQMQWVITQERGGGRPTPRV